MHHDKARRDRSLPSRRRWLGACSWALLAAVGCARASGPASVPEAGRRDAKHPAPSDSASASRSDEDVHSVFVAQLAAGTFGPHLVRTRQGRLAVWATEAGGDPGWYGLVFPDSGSPLGARKFAEFSPGLQFVRVRADGSDGVTVVSTRRMGSGEVVEALQLGGDGHLRGGPHVLAETPAEILWIDAVPTTEGALVMWAESSVRRADLYALPVGPLGPSDAPRRFARGVSGWQVRALDGGAAVLTVEAGAQNQDVSFRLLGRDGQPLANAVTLARGVAAGADVDLAVSKDRIIAAWSERRTHDQRLVWAMLDRRGVVVAPAAPATRPLGDQTWISLEAHPDATEVYAAWEEPARRRGQAREVLLGLVPEAPEKPGTPARMLEARQTFRVGGRDALLPRLVPSPDGLTVLSRDPTCAGEDCAPQATFLSPDLRIEGAASIRLGEGDPAELVWDADCASNGCGMLAARRTTPTSVFLTEVAPVEGVEAALRPVTAEARPSLVSEEAVFDIDPLSALQGLAGKAGTLLSWVTYFDPSTPWTVPNAPAPDGRRAPVRAILRTALSKPGAGTLALAETLSWRARSHSGLAMVPGAAGERLIVWGALDQQKPQVFATRVDAAGKKVQQRMLTRSAGEVMEVAAARVDDGFVLAWVDGRHEKPEIYAARLDERLEVTAERRITEGAVSPSEPRLLSRDGGVILVWSDARFAASRGYGDVFGTLLDQRDVSPSTSPRRLSATETHAESLALVAHGTGALLAWVESQPSLDGSGTAIVQLVDLDAQGRFTSPPVAIQLAASELAATCSLAPGRDDCGILATVRENERSVLMGFGWDGGQASEPRILSTVPAARQPLMPLLVGNEAFFVDARSGDSGVLRRISIDW